MRSDQDNSNGSKREAALRVYLTMLLNTLAAFIGGTIGWYAGALVGTVTAFVLSMVGSAAAVYFAKNLKARIGI